MQQFPLDSGAQVYQLDDQPLVNVAAVHTIAADANQFWVIDSIEWSYDSVPTGGRLSITIGGTLVFDVDITAAGPGHFDWSHAPRFTNLLNKGQPLKNEAVVITLASGGASAIGNLNVRYR